MDEEVLQPGENIRPTVSSEEVKSFIEKLYGLECKFFKELNGYDDRNYHVIVKNTNSNPCVNSANQDEYVFKIVNTLDSKKEDLFDAQTKLLLHLEKNNICCPRPIKNVHGNYYSTETLSSGNHVMRLLEFIPGSILHQVPITNALLYQCGEFVAKLDKALEDFSHPVFDQFKRLWMLESVPELKNFLFVINDKSKQNLVKEVVDQFESRVIPESDQFEKGMIHGDFNEQNIVVDKGNDGNWRIKAMLDFGDSSFSSYLFEVAIALTYMIIESKNLDSGGYVLAGFQKIKKLPEKEINLLRVCIAARFCQSLVLGAYSYLQDPKNTYVLTTAERGWLLLEELWSKSDEDILSKWNEIAQIADE